jgi:hypothetical protein
LSRSSVLLLRRMPSSMYPRWKWAGSKTVHWIDRWRAQPGHCRLRTNPLLQRQPPRGLAPARPPWIWLLRRADPPLSTQCRSRRMDSGRPPRHCCSPCRT